MPKAKLFSFKACDENYVIIWCDERTEFASQVWTCFALTRTITTIVHFTDLWLAQIFLSAVEWNFIYSWLSYSVLFLAHYHSYFRLSGLSIIQTMQLCSHESAWSRFDFNTEVRLCKRLKATAPHNKWVALVWYGLARAFVAGHTTGILLACVHRAFSFFFFLHIIAFKVRPAQPFILHKRACKSYYYCGMNSRTIPWENKSLVWY